MTDEEILEKLREYQTSFDNINADEMAEGPFADENETLETFGDRWEAAAKVIDRRGGLRVRFEFGDTDPALMVAARQREERAVAEARPHDDEHADDCQGCDGPGIVPCAADEVAGGFAMRDGRPIKDLRGDDRG